MGKKNIAKILAILLTVGLVVFVCAFIKNQYKTPVNNYYKGLLRTNIKTYSKAFPDFMGVDKTKSEDDLKQDMEELKSVFGNNIKIKHKIISKTSYKKEELETIKKFVQKRYNKDVKVSAGYKLEVEEKISGSKDSYTAKNDVYVYKIDGKWKMIPFSPEKVKSYVEE